MIYVQPIADAPEILQGRKFQESSDRASKSPRRHGNNAGKEQSLSGLDSLGVGSLLSVLSIAAILTAIGFRLSYVLSGYRNMSGLAMYPPSTSIHWLTR
jgi:hypothetical protein